MSPVEMTQQFSGPATLRGRVIYFAHPIDLVSLDPNQVQKMHRVMNALHQAGAVVYDPAAAFTVGPLAKPNPAVTQINRGAILAADAVVACYPETPGVGTAMEVQLADTLSMPSLVLSDVADRSWALAGLEHGRTVTEVNGDALAWLAEEAAEYAAVKGRAPRPEPMPLWVQLGQTGRLPVRKHEDDAGFDLFVSAETKVETGSIIDVPCDIACQLPENVWGLIVGRSSTSRTHHLLVHPGVIDTGYRGQLFVQVENLGESDFLAEPGMRLGQLIPLPNLAAQMAAIPTVALAPSARGIGGFGSTGR